VPYLQQYETDRSRSVAEANKVWRVLRKAGAEWRSLLSWKGRVGHASPQLVTAEVFLVEFRCTLFKFTYLIYLNLLPAGRHEVVSAIVNSTVTLRCRRPSQVDVVRWTFCPAHSATGNVREIYNGDLTEPSQTSGGYVSGR